MRILLAMILSAWGFSIYQREMRDVPQKPVVHFVSGVNVFSTSRWDGDILEAKTVNAGVATEYVWLEYWTLMYSIALGFAVLGRRMCNQGWAWTLLALSRIGRGGKMFWGMSRETAALLQDMHAHRLFHGAVVALEQDAHVSDAVRRARFDNLEDLGAIPVYESVSTGLRFGSFVPSARFPLFSRWRLWARRHFVFGQDDGINMQLCKAMIATWASPVRLVRLPKVVYVNLRSSTAAEELAIWLSANGKTVASARVDVKIQLLPDMIAQDFVRNHPVLLSPSVDLAKCPVNRTGADPAGDWATFRLLVVGGGYNGLALLNATIGDAQCEGLGFSATVVDANPARKDRYLLDCCTCAEDYKVEFKDMDALSVDFYQWFETTLDAADAPYSRVVVCLGDVGTNRLVAQRLGRIMALRGHAAAEVRETIFACGENSVGEEESDSRYYQMFGSTRTVFTVANVMDECNFALAKRINHAYCKVTPGVGSDAADWRYDMSGSRAAIERDWVRAGYYDRRSSIACAQGMVNWFRICGNDAQRLARHIDYFARCEHLRWSAHLLTDGVLKAPCSEHGEMLRFDEKRGYLAKIVDEDGMVRRHAALVPFAELDRLDRTIDRLNLEAFHARRLERKPSPSTLRQTDAKIILAVQAERLRP